MDAAIEALQKALDAEPKEALLLYNLACYYSLAGKRDAALEHLAQALNIEPQYRDMMGTETDFDPIRDDPEFQALASLLA